MTRKVEKMTRVRLPKWEPVHVELSTARVDRSFLEEAAEKMGSGYFVVEDGDDTYLLVSHRGMICEVGALETENGRRNIGQAFERVTLVDVERALDASDGTVSVYSLPQGVCVDLCGVINGRAQYGDLNTDILELDDLLGRLDDNFTGSVMFTSEDEYALLDYEDGKRVDFRYEGEASVEKPEDLGDATLGSMEANVFEPRDDEIDAPKPRERSNEVEMVDYDGIADALADATAAISSRDRFHDALEEQMELVEDAKFEREGGRVVTGAPDKMDVFTAYRKAAEASADIVPPSKIYDEAREEIESMEGGDDFLRLV